MNIFLVGGRCPHCDENNKKLLHSCVRDNVVSEFLWYAAEGQGSSSLACQSSAGYSQLLIQDSSIS